MTSVMGSARGSAPRSRPARLAWNFNYSWRTRCILTSMLAVHLENGRVSTCATSHAPQRPEGFALIRLLCGGICNTDLELQRGYYGFAGTPGHEFVGEVVEADSPGWVGRRVVGEINLACGDCEWCRRGLGPALPRRDGARNREASRRVSRIPDTAGAQSARAAATRSPPSAPSLSEPLAAACEILDQVPLPCSAAWPCWATENSDCSSRWC